MDQAGNQAIPVALVHRLWDYKAGVGDQTVAALKSFGLLDVIGAKDQRKIRLTENAIRILRNAPDRSKLLKQAALKPTMYNEIWSKYSGILPTDAVIENFLVWERPEGKRFIPSSADALIADLRATITFANVTVSDNLNSGTAVEIDPDGESTDMSESLVDPGTPNGRQLDPPPPPIGKIKQLPDPPVGYDSYPIALSRTDKAVLSFPRAISKKQFARLKAQIAITLDAIEIAYLEDEDNDSDS